MIFRTCEILTNHEKFEIVCCKKKSRYGGLDRLISTASAMSDLKFDHNYSVKDFEPKKKTLFSKGHNMILQRVE